MGDVVVEEPIEAVEDEQDQPVPESTEVAVIDHERQQPIPSGAASLPNPAEWRATLAVAKEICNTPFVPEAYRGKPESVVAAILYGREIGIGPMAALKQIHMIDGKPSMSADLIMAQMRKGGIVILESEATRERAWIKARRQDTGEEAEVEWTIGEAQSIPAKVRGSWTTLAEKDTWKSYPADMLWARVVGRLARRLGSDLLGGMVYAAEEVADWDKDDDTSGGYDSASASSASVTSAGIEARADAPRTWGQIAEALQEIDGGMPWSIWIEDALYSVAGVQKVAELEKGDQYRDATIMVANGVANLRQDMAGRDFPPPSREEIQMAFAAANSVGEVLPGPDIPLSPEEAAEMAPQTPSKDPEPEDEPEPSEGPGTLEDAPESRGSGSRPDPSIDRDNEDVPPGMLASDDIPFGEGS